MSGYYASVLFIGDSIMEGMAPFLPHACALADVYRADVFSKSGSSAKDWLENRWHLQAARTFGRPNVVVFALGTNVQERDEYEYAGIVRLLCETVQAVNASEVYFVGPFAVDDDGARNKAVGWAVRPPNAINGYELARGLPRAGEGGVHFTTEGYRLLAERLVQQIRPGIVRAQHPGRSLVGGLMQLATGAVLALKGPVLLPLLPFRPR